MVSVLVISKDSGVMPLFKVESGSVSCTQPQLLATDLLEARGQVSYRTFTWVCLWAESKRTWR